MSKIVTMLKKTPLRELWWKVKKIPPLKQLCAHYARKRRDEFLFQTLPDIYREHMNEPIQEDKVIFVELRYSELKNSLTPLYDYLQEHEQMDIHLHLINHSGVPRQIYVERCKKLAADMATAKYIFISDASEVVSCVPMRPETIVTQTWHACGAFKKFGLSTANLLFGFNAEEQQRHPMYANLTYVTVSSPEIIWAYAEAMNQKEHPEVIQPTGVSRTDIFFDQTEKEKAFQKLYEFFPAAKGKKVILYAPTFRGRVATAQTPDCLDLELFAKALSDEYVMITKHHPLVKQLPKIPEHLNGSFVMDATKALSIEDLLFVSDICISDYSSLIFEYSLFERPMIFYAYDLEDYFDWRGFYYNYEELTPGPICKTNEEMINYIQNMEQNFDRQKVIDFKEKFMSACDGHATERIMDLVLRSHR